MSQSAPPQNAVSVITQEFLVDDPCSIAVDVPGAVTTLRPGAPSEHVEVDISVSGCSPTEAEQVLDRMDVGSRQRKDTVQVSSNADRSDAAWWRWIRTLDVTLHIDLRCPPRVHADLDSPGGGIDIANLDGRFDLDIMGGPCRLHNLNGTIDIRAESSEVTIDDVTSDDLLARVAVGHLSVASVDADTLTLRSVGAPVSLTDAQGTVTITANGTPVTIDTIDGPCTAESQGGSLRYNGRPTADTDLTVVGAPLEVDLPSDTAADLTMSGPTLSLDDAFAFSGTRDDDEIAGTLNDGGVSFSLQAVGGPIECHAS